MIGVRTRRIGDVRIRRHVVAANLRVAARVDQIDVEKPVAGVSRIEREAEQAALAVGQNLAGHVEERRCQNLSGIKIEDLDQPGFLDDEQPIGIAGWRDGEQWLIETGGHPGRDDAGGVLLRSVRVVPVNDVRTRGAQQRVAAIVAYDEVRHRTLPYELTDRVAENSNETNYFCPPAPQ